MIWQMTGSHIIPYKNVLPRLGQRVFVGTGARLVGDLVAGDDCSFWFNTVVRADCHFIRIGRQVNIQDGTVIHVTNSRFATSISDNVSIGHNATIHGATVRAGSLIGMGAVLMDDVEIGEQCLVAAGALVTPGKKIPDRSLVMGNPARIARTVNADELAMLERTTRYYLEYKEEYRRQGDMIRTGP